MQKSGKRKPNDQRSIIKTVIIVFILISLLVGFYYYVSNKSNRKAEEDPGTLSKTQQMLQYNFDKKYPPSPKEVIRQYSEITKCFYNEDNSEEEIYALAMQIQKLYDDELIGNQEEGEYIQSLKSDIAFMKQGGYVISSYTISSSTDVEYYSGDGHEWASLYCLYSIRQGTAIVSTNEKFLLRKDSAGHWKIYGWTLADNLEE